MKRTGLILTLFVIVKTLCAGDAHGIAENRENLIQSGRQPLERGQLSRFVFEPTQFTALNSQLNPDKLDQAKNAVTDCSDLYFDFSSLSSSKSDGKEIKIALQLDKQIIKIPDEGSKTNMGALFKDLALYDKAIDHYKKSLQTKKKLGDESGEASDLDNLGQVYEAIGDYPNALQQYEQALGIFRKLGKADDEARTLNDIGELQKELGNYPLALDCYQTALAKFKTNSLMKDEAILQNNVSLIYEKLGMYDRALESHRLALAMFRKLGNPQDEAAAMLEIAETFLQMGKYDQGIKSALEALQLMKKAGFSTDEITGVVAGYLMDLGRTEEAETLLNKTNNVGSLARLALIKGDFRTASSLYSQELQRRSDHGSPHDKFYIYTGHGKTYQAMKDYPKAQEAFQAAVEASETIASTLAPSDRKRFFDTKINGFEPSEAYKGLALAKFRLNNPEGALAVSDLLKSRRFASYMSDGATSKKYGLPRDLFTRETELVNRMAALRKELNSTDKQKHKTKYDNLSVLINQSEKEFSGLIEEIRRRFPAYASIKYPKPFNLTEILINPEDYVIVFSAFDEGIARQLIHGNKIISSDFINRPLKDLEADIGAFRKNLADTNLQKFNPDLASSLFTSLFQGVLENVPEGASLRIISDGMLNLMPLDALVMTKKTDLSQTEIPEKSGPTGNDPPASNFFGDHYRLSLHQSISSMTMSKTASSKIRPPGNVLVLADPIFSTKDDRFDGSAPAPKSDTAGNLRAETAGFLNNSESGFDLSSRTMNFSPVFQSLEKIFPGRFTMLSGAKAGKSDLMTRVSQNSDGFGNIIFGTPVITTDSFPVVMEPFIALTTAPPGTDGYFSLSDILSLRMPSEMTAVVGSRAGSSDDADSGQGLADMALALQYAGAKSVLMPLWDHDPNSSKIFMEKFFAQIKTGGSKQESLRKAREQMRKEGYEHPHYWSGYALFGDL